jgi:hypothetical protein
LAETEIKSIDMRD